MGTTWAANLPASGLHLDGEFLRTAPKTCSMAAGTWGPIA